MHDWQTALIGLYTELSGFFQNNRPLRIFTIHNLAYQGKFPRSQFRLLGVDTSYYNLLEFWGKFSLMKAGIVFSDVLTTVSPTYAKEIQTEEFGAGLSKLIKQKKPKLLGILNGVDYSIWNPETDPYIPTKVLSPLVQQKQVQFILLGVGDPKLEQQFKELGKKYPKQTGFALTYNNYLAHQIEAGADIFLMPSRYEPSGLNDKYSLRYGTVPIAYKTGGLADSIIDYSSDVNKGTGFLFETYDKSHFLTAIDNALKVFQSKKEWTQLVRRGMQQDFSWQNSANAYFNIYQTRI
jgi:starch synthase